MNRLMIFIAGLIPWIFLTVGSSRSLGSPHSVSIETILGDPSRFDKKEVTVTGDLMLGDELSILKDGSTCKKVKVRGCVLWVSLRSWHVTLHGLALTKRRDLKYAPGFPSSARLGFGHLNAYPAELLADQIELPPNFP